MRRSLLALSAPILLIGFVAAAIEGPAHLSERVGGQPRGAAASALVHAGSLEQLESSPAVFDVLYRYGQNVPSGNGAYGPNATAPRSSWFLEYQRAGGTDVVAGILRHDPALIATGLKIFHFGLAREASNGSFPGSAWPFHGTALFLSEAAPALVMLASSVYASQFSAALVFNSTRMRLAAYFMVRSVHGPGNIDDSVKNHRWFEAAIALGATGLLARDRVLMGWSRRYAWKGIHMERRSGVMPEDGGHDTGYQALGMVSAARYLQLVPNSALYPALYDALRRGEAWELSRIGPDGSVNQAGDTRTAGCREHDPTGRCKTVFYALIFSALAHWAAISGSARYARASHLVWTRSGYGSP